MNWPGAAMLLFAGAVAADTTVYTCRDSGGNTVFSNRPCPAGGKSLGTRVYEDVPGSAGGATRYYLSHGGQPLRLLTQAVPRFVFRDAANDSWVTARTIYRETDHTYVLEGVPPGTAAGTVYVDADRDNPRDYPGDYRGAVPRDPGGAAATVTVHMEKIIHLRKPQDNAFPLPQWGNACEEKIALRTPLLLEWDALAGDSRYTYEVRRTECKPFAWKEAVVSVATAATRAHIDLPPSRPGEMYTLTLRAHGPRGQPIGLLMTHGANGYGWDYRFRIVR